MKQVLKIAAVSLIALCSWQAQACWWEDVTVVYDAKCNVQDIKYKGESQAEGSDVYKRVMTRVKNDLKANGGQCGSGTYCGSGAGSGKGATEDLRKDIVKMMYVVSDTEPGTSEQKKYIDNINSVRENQNKIKLNEITRSIALGRRAVALALESGKDVDERRAAIEKNDDVFKMLKEIAKLQAQNLQKINEITALRARLVAMNSIENIIAGGVRTVEDKAFKKTSSGEQE